MNNFLVFSRAWITSSPSRSSFSKIKASIIAILLGFIIASIVLAILGHNPIEAFSKIVQSSLSPRNTMFTLATIGILLIAALANIVAFKTGLFNIGVSGQMFFSGAMAVVVGIKNIHFEGPAEIFILILFSIILGGLIALLSGILKAIFNVHEVVSSILLNWGLYYVAKWIINKASVTTSSGATSIIPGVEGLQYNQNGLIIFIIGAILAFLLIFIFWKTTIGFNLKATGLSKEASRYAGLKVNRNILVSMLFSGLIAGLAGGFMFVLKERQVGVTYLNSNILPSEGFDGIAIALLAFSNPIGAIPVSILFGVLENGSIGLSVMGIDKEVSNLIIGIIIYFSAISILFERFRIVKLIWVFIKSKEKRTDFKELRISHKERKSNLLVKNQELVKQSGVHQTFFRKIKSWSRLQIWYFNNYQRYFREIKYLYGVIGSDYDIWISSYHANYTKNKEVSHAK